MYRIEPILRERQTENVDQTVDLGTVMSLVMSPQEIDFCRSTQELSFGLERKVKGDTVRQAVTPVVAKIDEDGRQVPGVRRIPWKIYDAVVLVNVDVCRVLSASSQYPERPKSCRSSFCLFFQKVAVHRSTNGDGLNFLFILITGRFTRCIFVDRNRPLNFGIG